MTHPGGRPPTRFLDDQFVDQMAREIIDGLTLREIQRLRNKLGIYVRERQGKVANYLRLQAGLPIGERNT